MSIPHDGLSLTKHIFITGQTGKGKSNTAIIGIMRRIEAGHDVRIIDSKRQLSQLFKRHASIYTPQQATSVITELVTEADRRMQLFDAAAEEYGEPIADVWEYEDITGIELPIISLVIEELLVITSLIDHDVLKKLLALGRSSGVFCYSLAQRASNEVIPSSIMVNFQVRVYLGAADMYAFKSMFPGGIPSKIKSQLDNHLGPVGHALVYNDDLFELIKFPAVSRELSKQFMGA